MLARTVALLLLFSMRAAVACSLDVDVANNGYWIGGSGRGYDVFDAGTSYQPLTIQVHMLDSACAFYLTATPGVIAGNDGLLSGPGASIHYTVYRDASGSQALRPVPVATQAEVLAGSVSQGASLATFQVTYSVAPQQIVPPGDYTGQITVSAYEGAVGSGILRTQQQVPITVHVASTTDISFSQGAFDEGQTSTTVPFGVMHQGDIRGATLHARSNAGYRILLRSDNGSAMRNLDASDSSAVLYDCFIDGSPIPLGKSDVVGTTSSTMTDPLGRAHRIDFLIKSIDQATAGDYKDVVTITVLSLK